MGSRERGARGLKVVDAIAVAPDGTPLGIAAMKWWARGPRRAPSKIERSTAEKECQHWLDAVDMTATATKSAAPGRRSLVSGRL